MISKTILKKGRMHAPAQLCLRTWMHRKAAKYFCQNVLIFPAGKLSFLVGQPHIYMTLRGGCCPAKKSEFPARMLREILWEKMHFWKLKIIIKKNKSFLPLSMFSSCFFVGLHYFRVSWGLQFSWELLSFETMVCLVCHEARANLQLHIWSAHEAFYTSACYILRAPYTLIRQGRRRTYVESLWCLVLRLHVQSDMLIAALSIINKGGRSVSLPLSGVFSFLEEIAHLSSFPGSLHPISAMLSLTGPSTDSSLWESRSVIPLLAEWCCRNKNNVIRDWWPLSFKDLPVAKKNK